MIKVESRQSGQRTGFLVSRAEATRQANADTHMRSSVLIFAARSKYRPEDTLTARLQKSRFRLSGAGDCSKAVAVRRR